MSSRFKRRYLLQSDQHEFVGRIYDLSMIALHFDSYEKLAEHADCKYAYDVNEALTALTRRVESLNMVGDMMWPTNMPRNFRTFPLSRYEWLTVSADVFLARYVSVVDCAMILVSEVFECGLSFEACSLRDLKKASVVHNVLSHLEEMISDQGLLRKERNRRFHHGLERQFSSDDQTLRIGSLFEHNFNGATGENRRSLPVARLFREGLVELQKEFNIVMRKIIKRLDCLYSMLESEFESRFSPKFRAGPFSHSSGN